jgi:hypothetical protein
LGPAHGFTLLPSLAEEALSGTSPPTGTSTPSFDRSKEQHPAGAWNPVEAAAALLAERCKGGGGGSESCSESGASHMSQLSMAGLLRDVTVSTSYRPQDVLNSAQAGSCVSTGGSDLLSEGEEEGEGEVCSDGLRRCGLMGLRNQSFEFARVPSPAELLSGADM